ncbi:MAG: hypothetical protein QOJ60_1989, partial [Actinomycetota bacterium]|nr:hypothetical protein [Actinomycetota bacterium]
MTTTVGVSSCWAGCKATHATERAPRPRRVSARGVIAAWRHAGWRAGACFGAVFGACLALPSRLYGLAIITTPVGGLVGAGCGLAVGAINGVVLAWLNGAGFLGGTLQTRLRRATTAAVVTTGLTMFAIQLALFGLISDRAPWFWLAYLPLANGLLTAAVLTRRLPPAHV